MKLAKRIFGNDKVRRVLCWLGARYIRFVLFTCQWSTVRGEIARDLWDRGEPFIACFWHARLLMMPACWDYSVPIYMLHSEHRDGMLIAHTVRHFGVRNVFGTTKKGGGKALRTFLRALKEGGCVGITPDGPHGPGFQVSDGIIGIARLSGAPIVPITYAVSRRKVLNTWDRLVVALPFGRGVYVWGEPIHVARDADAAALEAARRQVEDGLNAITEEADRLVGWTPSLTDPVGAGGSR
ncbi:MAG: lysophospholipid acyltransferase family protein [Rhodospirillales bacterium]|nr:lysophospholipid acyltransferase family protein [Rhodospirillales bacterium]